VFALHRALRSGSYQPGPFRQHVVRDPKTRLISTPCLRDRVLQQAIVDELAPCYDHRLIDHCYACRPGLGPQRAVLTHLAWTRRFRFRASIDIRRYFMSIDHAVLLNLWGARLRDRQTMDLLRRLVVTGGAVYRTPTAIETLGLDRAPVREGAGMPIGAVLSPWAANLYLDGLDHYLKRELKIPGYLRYMDDGVLFADDRGRLVAAREAIAVWLRDHRRLALNPRRPHVHKTEEPCTFLGYRVCRGGIAPARKLMRRMRGRMRHAAGRGPSAVMRTTAAYRALLAFG
jgi:retron-type reverse transcriptase